MSGILYTLRPPSRLPGSVGPWKEKEGIMWKRRLLETFAILTIGDGLIEILAPREHSRLWSVGPPFARRIAGWFAENPNVMRTLGVAQVAWGVWLALRQYRGL